MNRGMNKGMKGPNMAQRKQAQMAFARMTPAQKRQFAMQRQMMAAKIGRR